MLEVFVQSLLIGYSGAVMPGSLLTFTIDRSLKYGARSGLIVSVGHALLELVLVVAIFLGFGKYLSAAPVQIAIGILGGALLIILGGKMIKESLTKKLALDFTNPGAKQSGSLLISGAVLSACNPYFLIWWAVIGLGLITNAYSLFGLLGIALFYFGHILADISWYVFISVMVSKTRGFFNIRIYRGLVVVLGGLLIVFGLGFLINSGRGILALR